MFKIYIDPGHGTLIGTRQDPGAIALDGTKECDIVLDIATRVKAGLADKAQVLMSRTDSNSPYGIDARAAEANEWGADMVLSLHCNDFRDQTAYGAEALIYAKGGRAEKYAKVLLDKMCDQCGLYNRGVKVDSSLGILRKTKAPAVLIELAFMSNPSEAVRLACNTQKAFIATSIVSGLVDALQLNVTGETAYPVITHPDSNTYIIRTTPARFAVNWEDKPKQSVAAGRVIGGFFGTEKGGATVPGGNVCINGHTVVQAATAPTWSNLAGKPLTTLCVHDNGEAHIIKTDRLDDQIGLKCAISGLPILIDGQEVSLSRNVKAEGYYGSELYETFHMFATIQGSEIWLIGTKTGHANQVTSTTVMANLLKRIGCTGTVIKLDGGGSYFIRLRDSEAKKLGVPAYIGTSENRRINTSISY
jgi:hypothetical protein